jgi:DNA-binding NtrC family response regulator
MIAEDPAMKQVVTLADQVAGSDASILITGESGVGKEVMARYLHTHSKRAAGPFIAINCAAIPDNLLESELFGHEKNAFTGAVARRIGKFEEADGGTLLLDEISEMDLRLQAKLLRAIQERVIDRVGGSKPVPVNIRILATSNRDLAQSVRDGAFREDLLYRLNVVTLRIPPLRERKGDLLLLATHFINKYAAANGRSACALSQAAQAQLLAMPWRGNVRELENAMHRAVLLSRGAEIGPEAIRTPDGAAFDPSRADPAARAAEAAQTAARSLVGRTVSEVEQDLILETLTHCLGNRTHAANILGISIRTLRNKLKLYADAGVAVPPPPNGQPADAADLDAEAAA